MPNVHGMNWIRQEKRLAIYLRDRFTCAYCGKDLHGVRGGQCTLDHLTPRDHGGSNEATNLITCCHTCNSGRGAKPWTKFAPSGARKRIERQRYRAINVSLAKDILAGRCSVLEALR